MVFTRNTLTRRLALSLLSIAPLQSLATIVPANPSQNISWPYQAYKSANFTPPWLNVTHVVKPSEEGYYFFAPDGATEYQLAPLIMDAGGELVWNGPHEHAFNFGAYEYDGAAVLAWWNGSLFPEPVGRGNGVVYLYDDEYEQVAAVSLPGDFLELVPGATFPSNIDLHELFRWSSLDRLDQLPFTDSLYPLGSEGFTGESQSVAWGYFHINAVQPYDGGYLISSRYFCSVLAIDDSGHVKWRLQGRDGGDFKLIGSPEVTGFCYQHDVRWAAQNGSTLTIQMHDNHNCPIDNGTVPSTGKILSLDFQSKEARLVRRYLNNTGPVFTTAQGNFQPLSDGNVFVDHGWIPVMEEYSPAGKILSTIQFGAAVPRPGGGYLSAQKPTLSYRAFKNKWTGCPQSTPDVVAESSKDGRTTLFMSWNGATDVESWEIYGGNSSTKLSKIMNVHKSGFETKATIKKAVNYVAAKPMLKKGSKCRNPANSYKAVAV